MSQPKTKRDEPFLPEVINKKCQQICCFFLTTARHMYRKKQGTDLQHACEYFVVDWVLLLVQYFVIIGLEHRKAFMSSELHNPE